MGDCGFQLLRGTVFLLNLFFWLAGLGMLAIGTWLRFDAGVAKLMALKGDEQNLNLTCVLLLLAGATMTFIGFLGCCGAWKKSQCMLTTFFGVLVTAFCLQVACALYAYTHQETIRRYISQSMYEVVQFRYGQDEEYANAFDKIQTEFQCCGARSYEDWLRSSWGRMPSNRAEIGIGAGAIGKVPASCCNAEGFQSYPTNCGISFDKLELHTYAEFLHTQGCSEAVYNSVANNMQLIIMLCVTVACIQVFGLFLTILLCCWVHGKEKKKADHYQNKV